MKKLVLLTAVALIASPAMATDITISTEMTSCWLERYPAVLEFDIIGELTDTANDGLAAIGFDLNLAVNGAPVDLSTTDVLVTAGPDMGPFVPNWGLANPAGYGGTHVGGDLVQIGGAQDTINNAGTVAPFPTGPVEEGIGHTAVVLAHVTITLTDNPDSGEANAYTFTVDQVFGNVMDLDQDGPVYTVTALGNVPEDVAATFLRYSGCIWDMNGDRSVDPQDVGLVKFYYNCTVVPDPLPGDECSCRLADNNDDGAVDPADVGLVKFFYGSCD
jgi:hypothetical protein